MTSQHAFKTEYFVLPEKPECPTNFECDISKLARHFQLVILYTVKLYIVIDEIVFEMHQNKHDGFCLCH